MKLLSPKDLFRGLLALQSNGLIVVMCSSGIITIAVAVFKVNPSTSSIQASTQQPISLTGYERLDIGMTITDAQANLGQPAIEVNRDATTATYKWTNSDGSMITAVFKNNQLIRKNQINLK
jgi:hypothetical protein